MVKEPTGGELGQRIKKFRSEARPKMTQAKLAERSQLSPGYISELEGGTAIRPSGQVLMQLARALGVTIADLLGDAAAAPEPTVSTSLAEFASGRNLPQADVTMLASIRFRGEPPRTPRRWEHIYDTIRNSSAMDEDEV